MTDVAILDTLQPHAPVEILWKPHIFFPFHPNGMTFKAFDAQKKKLDEWTVFSVGGGALAEEGHDRTATNDIYNMNTMSQICTGANTPDAATGNTWSNAKVRRYGIFWQRYGRP